MPRLIDADALLEKVEKIQPWDPYPSKYAQGIRHCMEVVSLLIQDAPTIDPVRKGKWEKGIGENGVTASLFCSRCNYENRLWYEWNYCPNCGADMRGEKNG